MRSTWHLGLLLNDINSRQLNQWLAQKLQDLATEGEAARLLSYVFVQLRADDETVVLNKDWPLELNHRVKGLVCRVIPQPLFLGSSFPLAVLDFSTRIRTGKCVRSRTAQRRRWP